MTSIYKKRLHLTSYKGNQDEDCFPLSLEKFKIKFNYMKLQKRESCYALLWEYRHYILFCSIY